jgi:hypothetical protein
MLASSDSMSHATMPGDRPAPQLTPHGQLATAADASGAGPDLPAAARVPELTQDVWPPSPAWRSARSSGWTHTPLAQALTGPNRNTRE